MLALGFIPIDFFRDFDVFVKNVVFFVAGDILDGFGIPSLFHSEWQQLVIGCEMYYNVIRFAFKNFDDGKVNQPVLKINAKTCVKRDRFDFILKTKVFCGNTY